MHYYFFLCNPILLVDVESDEVDDLEFLQQYDMDEDEDDDDDIGEFVSNLPNDASVSTGFGKREITFAKVLVVSKNGTKAFSKYRQSAKIGGDARTSVTGHFNTSLDVRTSVSAKFAVNITISSKRHSVKTTADGTVIASSSSKSKIAKRRLIQHASVDSSTTVQIPALNNQVIHVNSSVRSGSETFKLPFRSYLTLFKAGSKTTTDNGSQTKTAIGGEVVSRVVFANKTVSLTKSCIKAYAKSKSAIRNNMNDDDVDDDANFEEQLQDSAQESADDEDNVDAEASTNVFQISLIKAKTHTWTKVVSHSKTQVVVDVITCTKTRAYGKSIQKGVAVTFAGSGQVSWEKSQITITAKRLNTLSPHEYGVHFIEKQLGSSSLVQLDTLGKFNIENDSKK